MGCTCIQLPGFEADDIMASLSESITQRFNTIISYLSYSCSLPNMSTVLLSFDKDMLQLVGPRVAVLNPQTRMSLSSEDIVIKYGVPPEVL